MSPLFWFYGSVGLTYAGEAFGASVVACFAFRALGGSATDAWLARAATSAWPAACGSRCCPAVAALARSRSLGVRRGAALVAGRAGSSGRRARLVRADDLAHAAGSSATSTPRASSPARWSSRPRSLGGPLEVTLRMSRYLLESVLVGARPARPSAALRCRWYARRHGWGAREWFLLAWTVPPVLVYTLVHFGQAGYVLTFLPALVILLARVLWRRWPRRAPSGCAGRSWRCGARPPPR